ncbi:MAG: MFS transporter [Lactobacillales bacterium]|nr:MFS transporter [Lactobacillales bacterium]
MIPFTEDSKVQKRRWIILSIVCMCTFMSCLDGSIVNIAMPDIQRELHVDTNQVQWIVSIYLIVCCSTLVLFGKLGDSLGKIKILKLGNLLFVAGSLMCALSGNLLFLLIARVLQGIGASMPMATNSGIITEIFKKEERGRALSLIGVFVSLGLIVGPGIGGILLSLFSWQAIFMINVPIGIVLFLVGQFVLPADRSKTHEKIDWASFVFWSLTIVFFFGTLFTLQDSGWRTPLLVPLVVAFVVGIGGFIALELKEKQQLIDLSMFKNRNFSHGLFAGVLLFTALFFNNLIFPFYLQETNHITEMHAGILMMIFPMSMVVFAPISGMLTDKLNPRALTQFGLALVIAGFSMYCIFGLKISIPLFVVAALLQGCGNAFFSTPNNTIVMSSVEPQDYGIASSLLALSRNLGSTIGSVVATSALFGAMSLFLGHSTKTYIEDRPDVFVNGMRVAFIIAAAISIAALVLVSTVNVKVRKK